MKRSSIYSIIFILFLLSAACIAFFLAEKEKSGSTDSTKADFENTGYVQADIQSAVMLAENGRQYEILFDLHAVYCKSPYTVHVTGTAAAAQNSRKTVLPFEAYLISNGGKKILYIGYGGKWTKADVQQDLFLFMRVDNNEVLSGELENSLLNPLFNPDDTAQIYSFCTNESFSAADEDGSSLIIVHPAESALASDTDTISKAMREALGIGTDGTVEIPRLKRASQRNSLGDNWYSFSMKLNDRIITLPCGYDDMTGTGLSLDTDEISPDTVIGGYSSISAFFRNDSSGSVTASIFNPYSTPRTLKECLITEVTGDSWTQEAGISVTSAGGVTIGTPEDEVIALYGQPDRTEEDDSYTIMTWTRNGNFHRSMAISFSKAAGTTDEIDLCRSE